MKGVLFLNTGEIRDVLSQAVHEIPFCKEGEEQGFYRVGDILAAPDKGVPNFLLHKERCEGKGYDREHARMNHWERVASLLAAAVFCSMVYGNSSRFMLNTKQEDVAIRVWNFLKKKRWTDLENRFASDGDHEKDMDTLERYLQELFSSVKLRSLMVGVYMIYVDSDKGVAAYDSLLKKCYPEDYWSDKRHPFLVHMEKEVLFLDNGRARGRFELRDIFLQMMEGIAICAGVK